MSRQRKKHPILVAQRKDDNEYIRQLEREGNLGIMPPRCRHWLKLIEQKNRSEIKKEQDELFNYFHCCSTLD